MAIGSISYDDASRREDLTDVITNVSPQKTPLLSGLQKGKAMNSLHEYLGQTYAAGTDNAAVEASSYTDVDLTHPTRLNNNTQIFTKYVTISGTQMAIDHAGGDTKRHQKAKAAKEMAKDMEHAIVRGSRASGSSGVARRMVGFINSISTNATTRASGSSLGETTFNDIMQMVYASTDDAPSEVYVGGTLKRDITQFSASNTRNVSADDRRLVSSVDVYVSDFGTHKIFLHRDVPSGANAKGLLAVSPENAALAFLRPVTMKPIAAQGDHDRTMLVGEMTLENRAEQAMAYVGGFTG